MPASHYDTVVVGARAAGAATAMLLARAGQRVLVVDRGRYGADTLSTHALMRGGVVQLHRWGLLDRIVDAGTPPVHRATFHFGDERLAIAVKPAHGVNALYAPRRTVLDPVLVDAAAEAGADVRFGVTVTDAVRDRQGRVTGIEARDGAGRPAGVNASLVVGADGMRSTIASRIGARPVWTGTSASAVVYGYWAGVASDGYDWVFRPDACAGVIPTNGGEVCVFAAASPARVGRGGMGVLTSILREASPEVAERVTVGRAPAGVRTFGGRVGFVRQAWGAGWALVGDAGSWKDPLTAHGLTDALRDAELLARAVIVDSGEEGLAAYQAARDRLSLPLVAIGDAVASQRWSVDEIAVLLRQLSAVMADEVDAIAAFDAVPVPL